MKLAVVCVVAACGTQVPKPISDAEIDARAAAVVDAFTNTDAIVTPDGHVVFVSNRDGLPQLYVGDVDHPDKPPVRLPVPKERVDTPSLMPDGKTIVFLSDVGADRKFHVFRIGIDGTGLADLTPAADQMRESLAVARTSGLIVYTSHTLEDQTTHIFAQTLDGPPREIYRDPAVGMITSIAADGSRLVFVRAISDSEQVAIVIDTAEGVPTRLYPREGDKVGIGDAALSADGAHVFIDSEEPGRPPRILRLDATTGAEQARFDEPTAITASFNNIAASPASDRIVVGVDAGDHTEMRILDARDLHALPLPSLPLGSFQLGRFTADGARLTFDGNTPAGPTDIAILDLPSQAITPLRREPRPGLAAPPKASIEKLRGFDGTTIPIDLYLPTTAHGRLPTLVLVHGGPSGSSKIGWNATIGFWTAMGFAVIAPNIRGSTGFGIAYMDADNREHRADAVKDIETVNQWARAQPWCDGDRLVIGGISYGGYMTLLALTRQPTLWRAGIDGSGMSNLKTMEQLEDQTIRAYDDTEFGVLGKDDALLAEWSPITAVDKITAPVFVYQGVRDPVTPQHEADQIVEALRARHVPVEYMLVDNEGHGVTRRENVVAYFARSYRFVAEHLHLRRYP